LGHDHRFGQFVKIVAKFLKQMPIKSINPNAHVLRVAEMTIMAFLGVHKAGGINP